MGAVPSVTTPYTVAREVGGGGQLQVYVDLLHALDVKVLAVLQLQQILFDIGHEKPPVWQKYSRLSVGMGGVADEKAHAAGDKIPELDHCGGH